MRQEDVLLQTPEAGNRERPQAWTGSPASVTVGDLLRTDDDRQKRQGTCGQQASSCAGVPEAASRRPAGDVWKSQRRANVHRGNMFGGFLQCSRLQPGQQVASPHSGRDLQGTAGSGQSEGGRQSRVIAACIATLSSTSGKRRAIDTAAPSTMRGPHNREKTQNQQETIEIDGKRDKQRVKVMFTGGVAKRAEVEA
ncbi:hypothetical protein PMIN01_06414 [Paraphaeosphaeria minitans]|uniref:Uncharacterized protein n=1 Tax=Paraphaeosphaeria minitans TaxID=565426 RepID=A0A9P6KQX3_9PLEO|nr:hypothetical protein PMIN01_06414 [Paraphaeosphaeria minitans]